MFLKKISWKKISRKKIPPKKISRKKIPEKILKKNLWTVGPEGPQRLQPKAAALRRSYKKADLGRQFY